MSFFGNLALNLMTFPDARVRILADLGLVSDAIEESLRYNTSAQRFSRTLTRDVELHGKTMRAGDKVMVVYGAANRDERQFENADVYDIDRKPSQHLGFGHGKHYCIGAGFARILTTILCEELLRAIPRYELAIETLDWLPSPAFRRMVTFPIRFENI